MESFPGHIVWAAKERSQVGLFPANVTVRPSSDISGSGSTFKQHSDADNTNTSLSWSIFEKKGEKSHAPDKVPYTVSEHKVWDEVNVTPGAASSSRGASAVLPLEPRSVCDSRDDLGFESELSDDESEVPVEGPPPSLGSKGHPGRCKPCHYAITKTGCRMGEACQFCHYSHTRQAKKKLSKRRRARYQHFMQKQEQHLVLDPDALKDIPASLPSAVQARPELQARIMSRLGAFAEAVRQQQPGDTSQSRRTHIVAL